MKRLSAAVAAPIAASVTSIPDADAVVEVVVSRNLLESIETLQKGSSLRAGRIYQRRVQAQVQHHDIGPRRQHLADDLRANGELVAEMRHSLYDQDIALIQDGTCGRRHFAGWLSLRVSKKAHELVHLGPDVPTILMLSPVRHEMSRVVQLLPFPSRLYVLFELDSVHRFIDVGFLFILLKAALVEARVSVDTRRSGGNPFRPRFPRLRSWSFVLAICIPPLCGFDSIGVLLRVAEECAP